MLNMVRTYKELYSCWTSIYIFYLSGIIWLNKYKKIFLAMAIVFVSGGQSSAFAYDLLMAYSPCVSGGEKVAVFGDVCQDNSGHDSGENSFIAYFGPGQKFGGIKSASVPQYGGGAYVPFSGMYNWRLHICPSITPHCTMRASNMYVDSTKAFLTSAQDIAHAAPDGTFKSTGVVTSPVASTVCSTLVDQEGIEWGSTASYFFCKDAPVLPDKPATCFLNYDGSDVSVDMGTLERSKIAISPVYGDTNNVNKVIKVLCTRDAGVTVTTTFQFTPITVSGSEVVKTPLTGLGVAIFYNGKLIGPSSTPVTEHFSVGYTDRELEFQAVRDPNVELKEIPTGDFTASAIMVMTEQ